MGKEKSLIRVINVFPSVIEAAGSNARYAYEEFFYGEIENSHTRSAYKRNVDRFLRYLADKELSLKDVTPKLVRNYMDDLKPISKNDPALSIATKKQHLAALRHFFDIAVTRHAMLLNPALSVRGQKYKVVEGKTPEIGIKEARKLLKSIDTSSVIGKRDLAIIATLAYTGARVGAVAKLTISDFYRSGDQYFFRFNEKGGKSREIPVRHDLKDLILAYMQEASNNSARKDAPLFRTLLRRTKVLSAKAVSAIDICRMVKLRVKQAGLSPRLSPHSFRVTVATDLLTQGLDVKDVQYLLGHADPRTTSLYDRRKQQVTRNLVERISI